MPFGLGMLSTRAERPTTDVLLPNWPSGGAPGGGGGGGGPPALLGGGGGGGGIVEEPACISAGNGGGGGGGAVCKSAGRGGGGDTIGVVCSSIGSRGGGGGALSETVDLLVGGWVSIGFSVLISMEVDWISQDFLTESSFMTTGVDVEALGTCWWTGEDFVSDWGTSSVCASFSFVFFTGVFSVAWETNCKSPWRVLCLPYNQI